MKKAIALILALCALCAYADKTTRRGLRVSEQPRKEAKSAVSADTVIPSPGMIELSGYEKPLRSNKESLFITNATRRLLLETVVEISYFDESGRLLHRRQVSIKTDVPPGETRQATFSSWDRQRVMYYHRSGKPRTADGTPYRIKTEVKSAVYAVK